MYVLNRTVQFQIPLLFDATTDFKRINPWDFHVLISCNFSIMEPYCFCTCCWKAGSTVKMLCCAYFEAIQDYFIKDLEMTDRLPLDFQLHNQKFLKMHVILLLKSREIFFGHFFPQIEQYLTWLWNFGEALFKWHCVFLYLFQYDKLHSKFKWTFNKDRSSIWGFQKKTDMAHITSFVSKLKMYSFWLLQCKLYNLSN